MSSVISYGLLVWGRLLHCVRLLTSIQSSRTITFFFRNLASSKDVLALPICIFISHKTSPYMHNSTELTHLHSWGQGTHVQHMITEIRLMGFALQGSKTVTVFNITKKWKQAIPLFMYCPFRNNCTAKWCLVTVLGGSPLRGKRSVNLGDWIQCDWVTKLACTRRETFRAC